MRQHYYYFNAFRVLAALIVMAAHARCEIFQEYSLLDASSQNVGIQVFFALPCTVVAMSIFFVLSGFLVGGPALEKLYQRVKDGVQAVDNQKTACNFMINRVLRITPPLLVAIIFAAMVKYMGGIEFTWMDAFLNLFGLQGVCATDFGGVYWSIAYEVWFYVLIGSILCLFSGKSYFGIGVTLLAITGIIFITLPVRWLLTILFGTLLYFAKGFRLKKSTIIMLAMLIVVCYGLSIISAASRAFQFPLQGILNKNYPDWIINICTGLIIVSFCQQVPQGKIGKRIEAFGNRWAPMTYCLYITHFTVLELYKCLFGRINHLDVYAYITYIAMCMVCLCVGFIFYRIVEEPIVKYLKPRLIRK